MLRKIPLLIFSGICILAGSSCRQSVDPVSELATYLDSCLDILEKYKDDAPKAGEELYKFRSKQEAKVSSMLNDIKDYNPEGNPELTARATKILTPLADRMRILLHENPALFLNEYIEKAFAEFDLGI